MSQRHDGAEKESPAEIGYSGQRLAVGDIRREHTHLLLGEDMELNDILVPLICGIIGGIGGTAVFLRLKKKDE